MEEGTQDSNDHTIEFVKRSKNLLIWECRRPCVFLSPPHCFHAVLTFELACHTGCRIGSLIWLPEMNFIVKYLKLRRGKLIKEERNLLDLELDVRTWNGWLNNRKGLSTKELDFVKDLQSLLTGWSQAMKESYISDS